MSHDTPTITYYQTTYPVVVANVFSCDKATIARVYYALLLQQSKAQAQLCSIRAAIKANPKLLRLKRTKNGALHVQLDDHFTYEKIAEVCELKLRTVREAVAELIEKKILLTFQPAKIEFNMEPINKDAETLLEEVRGKRSVKRPIPFPRPILESLASCRHLYGLKLATTIIVRCVSFSKEEGGISTIRNAGTLKSSKVIGLTRPDKSEMKKLRSQYISRGFITKDTGSRQWKKNRDGAYTTVNLDWKGDLAFIKASSKRKKINAGDEDMGGGLEYMEVDRDTPSKTLSNPPLTTEKCGDRPPLLKDSETPYGCIKTRDASKEAPGVCTPTVPSEYMQESLNPSVPVNVPTTTAIKSITLPPAVAPQFTRDKCTENKRYMSLPPVDIKNVLIDDLTDAIRVEKLYWQAVNTGLIQCNEIMALTWLAAAKKASRAEKKGQGNAAAIFMSIFKRKLWGHISSELEDEARAALRNLRAKKGEYLFRTETREESGNPFDLGSLGSLTKSVPHANDYYMEMR